MAHLIDPGFCMFEYSPIPEKDPTHKELIILVKYVNVPGRSQAYIGTLLAEANANFQNQLKEWSNSSNYTIKGIIVASQHESKIECIFPVSQILADEFDFTMKEEDDDTLKQFE